MSKMKYSIESLSYNLRVLQAKKRCTQREISKILGKNENVYNLKLNGKIEFSLKDLKKLTEFFNVSIADLFLDENAS